MRRAKSGDADSFVQLYDAYGDDVYRYIYFRVINDVAAEGLTSTVFRYAWEHLDNYKKDGSSFIEWIYKIVRIQVINYYRANTKTPVFDIGFLSAAADYGLKKEGQDAFDQLAWHNHLQLLAEEKQHTLLQISTLRTMARYLEYLNPIREIKPSPTFNAYTRPWLTRYLQFHTRRPKKTSTSWKLSLAYVVLIAAVLFTGTAKAQSALPGELLYGWKRTSEQAWRSLSPNPVDTDIILADRRLNEWIAVENDPARSASASTDYFDELARLQTARSTQLIPLLKAHRQRLSEAGLPTTQLNNYLVVSADPIPALAPTQVSLTEIVPPATEIPLGSVSQPTRDSINLAAPASQVPIEVPPTEVPTEVVVPTEVLTEVPTEVAPPTEVPTEIAPPATEVPTPIANPEAPTDIPQNNPTDANP